MNIAYSIMRITLVQNTLIKQQNPSLSSFLDGARKEVRQRRTKFNARDESRSLMPVDGANRAIKSPFIHRFPIRSILLNFAPTHFFTISTIQQWGLTTEIKIYLPHLSYYCQFCIHLQYILHSYYYIFRQINLEMHASQNICWTFPCFTMKVVIFFTYHSTGCERNLLTF